MNAATPAIPARYSYNTRRFTVALQPAHYPSSDVRNIIMKTLILVAGAAALAVTTPALANPGKGQGNKGNPHAQKSQAKAHGQGKHGKNAVKSRYGKRHYALDARGSCPPGLAKKNNGCMPPGQAKKAYNVGQRYNRNFGYRWTYNQIPTDLRARYSFDRDDRYYYRNGYLYQVDPRTMLIERAVSALLR